MIKIKPLIWENNGYVKYADTPFGQAIITHFDSGIFELDFPSFDCEINFKTEEEAKEYFRDYYENAVKNSLEE